MGRIARYIVIFGCFLLAGCATSLPSSMVGGDCYGKTLPTLLDATDLKPLFESMAAELCTDTCSDCSSTLTAGQKITPACFNRDDASRKTVLVTDFADIQSFQPNQSGLLMGELMRGSLSNVCCYKIIQAEFGKYFKLSENGLVVLTRNANEIKNDEYFKSEAIVGTYSYMSNNKVVIFARRMNTETGKISRMVTKEVSYSCGGRSILGYTVK